MVVLRTSVVFILVAVAAHHVTPLPTTTTTTTTTTTPPLQVETGPVSQAFGDPCMRCERRFLEPYFEPMRQHNMTKMASVLNYVCDTAVPAVEQCKRDTGLQRCLNEFASPWLPTYKFFCQHRAVIQASTACWANGYREGMLECLDVFIAEGPTVGACQGFRNMDTCVRTRMQQIPQCSAQAVAFTSDYLTFAGQYVCPDLSSP